MANLLSNDELMKLIREQKQKTSGIKPVDNDLYRIYSFLEKYEIIPTEGSERHTVKAFLLHELYNMVNPTNPISNYATFVHGVKCFLDFDPHKHRFSVTMDAKGLLNKLHQHLNAVKERKHAQQKRGVLRKFLENFCIKPGEYIIKLRVFYALYRKLHWEMNRRPTLTIKDFEKYIDEFLPRVDDYVKIETVEHLLTPLQFAKLIKSQKASQG